MEEWRVRLNAHIFGLVFKLREQRYDLPKANGLYLDNLGMVHGFKRRWFHRIHFLGDWLYRKYLIEGIRAFSR